MDSGGFGSWDLGRAQWTRGDWGLGIWGVLNGLGGLGVLGFEVFCRLYRFMDTSGVHAASTALLTESVSPFSHAERRTPA
jgi:hypothetical protein